MRKQNLEFRWSEDNNRHEFIKWWSKYGEEEYCIVIAFFDLSEESYEIKFVGKRPFEFENKDLLWSMLEYGQAVVDAEYKLYEQIKE